jgi:hypothetical protein
MKTHLKAYSFDKEDRATGAEPVGCIDADAMPIEP